MKTFYHADDFGVTIEQSLKILECFNSGVLNSVSIIPNSKHSVEAYELIEEYVQSGAIRLVIHLNFVEGPAMANPSDVPYLVDESGYFNCSYGRILKGSFSSKHKVLKEQFKNEIYHQIDSIVKLTNSRIINVDSHQHYLQIPVVFEAFTEVVKENNYIVNYLRNPVDPVSPVLSTPTLFFNVPLMNHVKWLLLRILKPSKSSIETLDCNIPIFFGMPFTCQMTYDRVKKLLPKYAKIAQKNNRDLELMFHPGAVMEKNNLLDSAQDDLVEFYSSNYRQQEFETLISLNK